MFWTGFVNAEATLRPYRLGRPSRNGREAGTGGESWAMKNAFFGARFDDRIAGAAEDAKTGLSSENSERYVCGMTPLRQACTSSANVIEFQSVGPIKPTPAATRALWLAARE